MYRTGSGGFAQGFQANPGESKRIGASPRGAASALEIAAPSLLEAASALEIADPSLLGAASALEIAAPSLLGAACALRLVI